MSSQSQTRQAEAVPVWLPDPELGAKYRRRKGKEGVLGKASVEATETAELFQRAVFGRFLSLLPGGHRSTSPNHRVVQLAWLRGSGETRGMAGRWYRGSLGCFLVGFFWGVVPVPHPDFAISEPGRKLLLGQGPSWWLHPAETWPGEQVLPWKIDASAVDGGEDMQGRVEGYGGVG